MMARRSCDTAGIEDYLYRVSGMFLGFFEEGS
jgi:hypothetical protein